MLSEGAFFSGCKLPQDLFPASGPHWGSFDVFPFFYEWTWVVSSFLYCTTCIHEEEDRRRSLVPLSANHHHQCCQLWARSICQNFQKKMCQFTTFFFTCSTKFCTSNGRVKTVNKSLRFWNLDTSDFIHFWGLQNCAHWYHWAGAVGRAMIGLWGGGGGGWMRERARQSSRIDRWEEGVKMKGKVGHVDLPSTYYHCPPHWKLLL